ncbi:cupin domain-containing protein [Vibrio astriarenae]|uniref:hypothetical protein n=1 Tax=Vibrio astriarenae TaxID=1481923 RepID=UPI003735FBEC
MEDYVVKNIIESENVWHFLDGSTRSAERLSSAFVGIGTYKPGWRWSTHVGAQSGNKSEHHVGYVIEGRLTIRSESGIETLVSPGEAFELCAGHDAWVEGEETCIALDFGILP